MFCRYDDHTCVIEHKIHKYIPNVQIGPVTIFYKYKYKIIKMYINKNNYVIRLLLYTLHVYAREGTRYIQ